MVLATLIDYQPSVNMDIKDAVLAHNKEINFSLLVNKNSRVIIAPTCSLTDENRRISNNAWGNICNLLLKKFGSLPFHLESPNTHKIILESN